MFNLECTILIETICVAIIINSIQANVKWDVGYTDSGDL